MSSRRRDVKGTSVGGGRRQEEKRRRAAWDSFTLLPTRPKSNREAAKACRKAGPKSETGIENRKARCYHRDRNETANHRAGVGHLTARRRAHCRPAHRGQFSGGSQST